ncbi:MAG: acyl-CoA dehydrogenase family protein, partial [Achromobacter sp.]
MDLEFTPEENAFRDEVRAFLAEHLPERLSAKVAGGKLLARADMVEWHAILNRRGWLASHWPVEYGGTGWSTVEKYIFDEECALAAAPRI